MILLYLVLFINSVWSESCHTIDGQCPNNMFCGSKSGSCYTKCDEGCQYYQSSKTGNQKICINTTHTIPIQNYIGCDQKNPLSWTNYNCNMNGYGTYCPYGCNLKDKTCQSLDKSLYLCHPEDSYQCPEYCHYQRSSNSCISSDPKIVCDLVIKNNKFICPYGCAYNEFYNKCITNNNNIVCSLEYNISCPIYCQADKTKCSGQVCHYTSPPVCPSNCKYDSLSNLCYPTKENVYCEPMIINICPYDVYASYDYNIPICSISNSIDICINSAGLIQYPWRLKNKYQNKIKCKYSNQYCYMIYSNTSPKMNCIVGPCWEKSEICCN